MTVIELAAQAVDILRNFYNAFVLKFDSCYTSTTTDRTISEAGMLDTRGCNAIQFTNQGNGTVTINDSYRLEPGESRSVNQCMPYVEDNTDYRVSFDPADDNKRLVVTTTYVNVTRRRL